MISAGAYRQYTHIHPCVQVQLKYGKMIHFLFPEKAFLHQLIGMIFFLSFFYLLLFHNSDGVTGLLFPLKHTLGYNVYPAPPFSDCDHLFWTTTLQFSIAGFYPLVDDNLRNGFISLCSFYLLHRKQSNSMFLIE